MAQTVVILDFGGQYNQLIARRVREQNVYCELLPYNTSIEKIKQKNPIGIIFTGGPNSVYLDGSPMVDKAIFDLGIPVLGICYGAQLMAHLLGGKIESGPREYGKQQLIPLFGKLSSGLTQSVCWMSHTDYIQSLPKGFIITAKTATCPVAMMENPDKKLYGVQFHPEVMHTEQGNLVLKNFLYDICAAKGDWKMSNFAQSMIEKLKISLKGKRVLCALSGGVDSAVAAALVHKACPDLICVFVDHGLLRKGEAEEVVKVFKDQQKMNLIKVDARDRFLTRLKGIKDPDQKRKIIGEEFIRVFEEEGKKIGAVDCLVQGTIYADVVESGVGMGAKIKAHHNVGGLPDVIDFKEIVEPLRELFKDEVRDCGFEIGLPKSVVMRQPFPGPGLAIRIIGDITEDKLEILREADFALRDEIRLAGLEQDIWQYFTVLLDSRSIGVVGDAKSYGYTCAVRAVTGIDGMTADWAKIPFEILEKISVRITNNVKEIGRVVYDITSKPPATIEWE